MVPDRFKGGGGPLAFLAVVKVTTFKSPDAVNITQSLLLFAEFGDQFFSFHVTTVIVLAAIVISLSWYLCCFHFLIHVTI